MAGRVDVAVLVRERLGRVFGWRSEPALIPAVVVPPGGGAVDPLSAPGPVRPVAAPPLPVPGRAGPVVTLPGAGPVDPAPVPGPAGLVVAPPDADVVDRPPGLAGPAVIPPGAAFDPGRRGLRALAVVAALVLVGAAFFAWQARPKSSPLAPAPMSSGATDAVPAILVVAVTGRVRKPGLVRLPAGARVADAIEAAGGPLPGTDLSLLNVARKVTDGELIAVGVSPAGATGASGGPAPGGDGGKVNLNTATLAQLDALPGVGPVLAQRIIEYRQRHGGFRSVSELRQVDGIGDERFQQLKELVTT